LNFSLHKISTFFKANIGSALKAFRWSHLFKTMHQLNRASFSNPLTVQLFDRYATYNGSNPYQAPGMLSLIPHIEHNEGAYYPQGGMISITNALYQLSLKKGVLFEFEAPVERIIQTEGCINGVVVKGTNIPADIVVSNMDVYFTYNQLLQDNRKAKKLLKQERSSSALIFYWGMKTEFPELGLHNIFFSKNYEAEFEHIFRLKKITDDPTIYINITCKCEPGVQAPRGKENWFVMVNVPANDGQDWHAYREKYRKSILSKLAEILQKDIASLIETEQVLDPVLIEAGTASFMGAIYGTSANSKTAAFVRHPNFSKKIKGLYFVGGTVHPGGGIPLCLQSAKIMSELVLADVKKMHV
jgi:phytoene desaturase